ncbi:hypothetical protein RDG66_12150 [Vibrio cholerae]|uniref:hypothetical protein n=1 Tax=Vibrio cholerae TaxID=666 RepID=UPI00163C6F6B|nr:hypothetical protein [Vibrio cholerae]EJL6524635.1 hypothetical protein [Vibrio cholerae]ELH4197503.1 hypothetical protein [Vibrio cholerae]EMC8146621.1 hypothetical protein [Vibrio cholerae]MCX9559853.1 hypothetical protein [Vibrio cholerae]MCX9561080.1 hypothetical protein [Vibrio cholerae]
MKALMGEMAKKIRKDKDGKEALRRFVKSDSNCKKITLSNGKTYTITREKRQENMAEPA